MAPPEKNNSIGTNELFVDDNFFIRVTFKIAAMLRSYKVRNLLKQSESVTLEWM